MDFKGDDDVVVGVAVDCWLVIAGCCLLFVGVFVGVVVVVAVVGVVLVIPVNPHGVRFPVQFCHGFMASCC